MKTTLKTFLKHCSGTPNVSVFKDGMFDMYGRRPPFEYQWADDVYSGIKHCGWYTDPNGETFKDGTGICRGFVIYWPETLNFPDGRWLAGYWIGGSDRWCVHPEIHDDRDDAAQEADHMAEQFAEVEREHAERWQAARDVEYEVEEGGRRLRELLLLRHKGLDYVRDEITEVIEKIRAGRERLKSEFKDVL